MTSAAQQLKCKESVAPAARIGAVSELGKPNHLETRLAIWSAEIELAGMNKRRLTALLRVAPCRGESDEAKDLAETIAMLDSLGFQAK